MSGLHGDILLIVGISEKILGALLWQQANSLKTVNEKYRTDAEEAIMQT